MIYPKLISNVTNSIVNHYQYDDKCNNNPQMIGLDLPQYDSQRPQKYGKVWIRMKGWIRANQWCNLFKHCFLLRPYQQNRFSNTFFDAIIAFTPNKVLLRKTCFLGRKNHTSLLSIYCASGGGFAGGGRGPCD